MLSLQSIAAAQTRMAITEDWMGNSHKDTLTEIAWLAASPSRSQGSTVSHSWCPHLLFWRVHFGKRKKKKIKNP